MSKQRIIENILKEYAYLSDDGGISPKINEDLLITAIENLGYTSFFSNRKLSDKLSEMYRDYDDVPDQDYENRYAPEDGPEDGAGDVDPSDSKIEEPVSTSFVITGPKGGDHLSPYEIGVIKRLIPSIRISDEDLQDFDIKHPPTPVSNHPSGHQKGRIGITSHQIEEVLKTTPLKIEISPTRVVVVKKVKAKKSKLEQADTALLYFNTKDAKSVTSKFFTQIANFVRFCTEHPGAFSASDKKEFAPITAEKMQVNQLNDYFQKNIDNIKYRLFMKDAGIAVDTKVSVNSAEHLTATKSVKADFQLSNDGKPVFWISFKNANYLDSTGGEKLLPPGFRGYGPTIGIGRALQNNEGWMKLMRKLINEITTKLTVSNPPLDLSNNPKLERSRLKSGGGGLEFINKVNGVPIHKALHNNPLFLQRFRARRLTVEKLVESPLAKKFIYNAPAESFKIGMDFLDGTDLSKEIAGKAIYGIDFKLNDTNPSFGPNNVNVLMKSKTNIVVSSTDPMEDSTPSMLVKTDVAGHLLFNPNLPLPKDIYDTILAYRPIFYAHSSQNDTYAIDIDDTSYLFLGFRIEVVPAGKVF